MSVHRTVRAASAALLVLVLAAPGVRADDGDDARKGFDFGKDQPTAPTAPTPGDRAGAAPTAPGVSDDPIENEVAALRGWPQRAAAKAAEALFLRQKEAVPYLLRALKDGDPEVQAGAAWVLGQVGDEVHVQVILGAAAKRPNASRADVFFKAAYNLDAPAAKRWLISFLTVANRPVFREQAAEFLVEKVGATDRDRVLNLLESDKPDVRIAALKLLAPAAVEDADERLIGAFSDLTPAVAHEAARILAERADDALLVRLNAYAREAGARERAYAVIALVEVARAQSTNPFEESTVAELSGRRGLLHPERFSRGAGAVGLAYGALESSDPNLSALLDGRVVDVLIETLGGAHFRDYASLTPSIFAALRRLTGQDLADTAVTWAQWWRSNRTTFRARRPLQRLEAADMNRAYVEISAIAANGRRTAASFVPERGIERPGAFILKQQAFEGLVAFLEGEGLFEATERGGIRADEHVAVTLGVLNQRKLQVVPAIRPQADEAAQQENRARYDRLRMRMDALIEANAWQRYRDTDKWPDARAWWSTNVDAMAEAAPDQQQALLQAAIVFAYDDLPDDLARAEALARLQQMGAVLTPVEARQLATELATATTFGAMEADGLRWIVEQGHPEVREAIAGVVADRVEPEAREILAGILLAGGVERIRQGFADPRVGMRSAAAHASRLLVESGAVQQRAAEEQEAMRERLRPGLEVLSLDDDPGVSVRALIAMAYLGDANVVDHLERIYKGGNLNVKLEVTRALGYIPGNASHRLLTRVMAEERGDGSAGALRSAALESMARTNHRDAVRLLRYYLLNDRDPAVQDAAGRVLAEMGTGEASFAIVEHLTGGEPDAERRARLVDVLGRFRGDEVTPTLLRRYLGDEDQRVRAVAALRAADHNMADAFPFLVQLLRSGEGTQRDEAVQALENLTSVRFAVQGYAALATRYSQWFEDARVKGGSDRVWFREALRRKGYDVGPLASYLADEEDYGPVALLIRVLRDDDVILRRNAAIALQRIVGRSFGTVDRSTSLREAGRIADAWQQWYDKRRNARPGGGAAGR